MPAFLVATWRRIHNYPHEPDDIEGYEEGVARTIEGAASLAVKVWFLYHLDGYWQAYADNKMVEEYHELEAAAWLNQSRKRNRRTNHEQGE